MKIYIIGAERGSTEREESNMIEDIFSPSPMIYQNVLNHLVRMK